MNPEPVCPECEGEGCDLCSPPDPESFNEEWCDRCSPARCTCLDDDPDAREDYPGEGWATDPICFCGSLFSDHGEGSGHSPVEMHNDRILRPPKPVPDEAF